ncbi:MAG: CesT family type III secretion system chaperone [Candidatus Thorarchaeota archaeon]
MSNTWYMTKEYLKRLKIDFVEYGRKTFGIPQGVTETREVEVFPGSTWITLSTRLADISGMDRENRAALYENLLRLNSSVVEVTFGVDKKNHVVVKNALPVEGITYDAFSAVYQAHISGIRLFQEKVLPWIKRS